MGTFRTWLEASENPDSPEFMAWFGASKVADKQGKPILVYHGTVDDFEKFKTEPHEFGKLYSGDVGAGFLGAFFTEDRGVAETYPASYRIEATPQVVTAYLRIEHPKTFKTLVALRDDMLKVYGGTEAFYANGFKERFAAARELAVQYKKQLVAQGCDGIMFREGPSWKPNKRGMQANTWIAFSNDRIRIAGREPRS